MDQIPHGPKHLICPQHRKKMSLVCHTCPWWVQIRGKDPQTGKELDQWSCAVALLPTVILETAHQTKSVAAATESFRNEVVAANERAVKERLGLARPSPPPMLIEEG
jgi:hypothetical protein